MIEYVEGFVMSAELKAITNRAARWKKFLREVPEGKEICDCILASTRGWKGLDIIAETISAYSIGSGPEHALPYGIHENKSIEEQISSRAFPQIFNAAACIGSVLQLSITRTKNLD